MPDTATATATSKSDVTAKLDSLTGAIEKLAATSDKSTSQNRNGFLEGAPAARKGESVLTSRGYSYAKLFQLMAKMTDADDAKVEVGVHNALHKLYVERYGYSKAEKNSILAPMSAALLAQQSPEDAKYAIELGDMIKAGSIGVDPDQIAWMRQKTLSYTDETALGSTVAPPVQGELIDLLRNNEVFMQAGARVMALPPNGRIVFPRQTAPSSAYWVGENTTITDSEPTTGDVTLSAKKLAALVKIPNELFRFSSINIESFVREDIAKVCGLKLDSALLQGVGATTSPKGIINYDNINTHTALTVGVDGNTFQPEDVALMIGKVEEQNAVFKSFIMRPLLYTALVNRRADAVTAADGKGPFVFQYLRGLDENFPLTRGAPANLYGYPCYKSTNVSNTRAKGVATNLSYILGGDFTDYMIGMSAVMEFALNTQAQDAFTKDQTWIRGIMLVDGAPRHEKSFILCDTLVVA